MNVGEDYEVIQDKNAPKGRRIVKKGKAVPKEVNAPVDDWGTDSGDQFSDAQLRDAIKETTGKAPGPRTSRENLIKQFNELNANGS